MRTFASLWAPAFLKKRWSHNIDCSVYMCIKLQCQHLHLQHYNFAFLGSGEFAASGRFYLLCILGNCYEQSTNRQYYCSKSFVLLIISETTKKSKLRVGLWDGSFSVSSLALYYPSAIFIRHSHLLPHFFHLYRSRQPKMQHQRKRKAPHTTAVGPVKRGKVTSVIQTAATWVAPAYPCTQTSRCDLEDDGER